MGTGKEEERRGEKKRSQSSYEWMAYLGYEMDTGIR